MLADDIDEARSMHAAGSTPAEISQLFGVHLASVYRWLQPPKPKQLHRPLTDRQFAAVHKALSGPPRATRWLGGHIPAIRWTLAEIRLLLQQRYDCQNALFGCQTGSLFACQFQVVCSDDL